ncbi:MAG: UDP-2,3-diacylglucosamine diphosphatase [Bacteroidales bacterium]|nr:UDP-2,3-diacylglucosamine diphosphatase [Bacteroidales bacterium]
MEKIYFLSDAHLGSSTFSNPIEKEKKLVRFLDSIKDDAKELYLLGDILDFWYEFKNVVPRGFTRLFGKIAELTDKGVKVYWFTGNHDIWIFDYLPKEIGVIIHRQPIVKEINGKKFFLAHGDGLGDDSLSYKFMSRFFRNRFCQRIFTSIHPRWTVSFAHKWSAHSRLNGSDYDSFLGEDKEHLVIFSKKILENNDINFFIYGHRHIMLDLMIKKESRVVILGDWVNLFSYGVLEGDDFRLEQFEEEQGNLDNERQGVSIAF